MTPHHRPVSPPRLDEWIWGFLAGCAFAAALATLAAFLLWVRS